MDPHSLPIHQDVLFCRSHGHSKLCDGFVCHQGFDCQSGCCGTFGSLSSDFCQPTIEGVCPVEGFTYGEHGDIYRDNIEDLEAVPPLPPQFNQDGTGDKPAGDAEK